MYSEQLFNDVLKRAEEGTNINDEAINNIRYADDAILFATSMEDLESLLNNVVKYMIISKRQINVLCDKYVRSIASTNSVFRKHAK